MKRTLLPLAALLSGCTLMSSWHWEKDGAGDAEYAADLRHCKSQTEQPLDGAVTTASVRRLQQCLAQRGWRKVDNR